MVGSSFSRKLLTCLTSCEVTALSVPAKPFTNVFCATLREIATVKALASFAASASDSCPMMSAASAARPKREPSGSIRA